MGQLEQFVIDSIYPHLSFEALGELAAHLAPVQASSDLIQLRCPQCHTDSSHFQGTGVLHCPSCGVLPLLDVIADGLSLTPAKTAFKLSKLLNQRIPLNVFDGHELEGCSFSEVLLQLVKMQSIHPDLHLAGWYNSEVLHSRRLIHIESAICTIDRMKSLFGWIPRNVERDLKAMEGKAGLGFVHNKKLYFQSLNDSMPNVAPIIPIWAKAGSQFNRFFISDNLLFLEFCSLHGYSGAYMQSTEKNTPKVKQFLQTLSAKKHVVAVWTLEANMDFNLGLNEQRHNYEWFANGTPNAYSRIRKIIGA